jgi:hypothetical protein
MSEDVIFAGKILCQGFDEFSPWESDTCMFLARPFSMDSLQLSATWLELSGSLARRIPL